MQHLNENIKNQYKQRLIESILNENIQIDEQSGPIRAIIKGTRGRLGAAGRAAGRVLGQHEFWKPFGSAGKSYRIIRNHAGDVTHIYVEGHGWVTPQEWLDLFLENIEAQAKVTLDPNWIQDIRSGRGSGFSRIDRNLFRFNRFLEYLPAVTPGLGGIIPDTVDSEPDPTSGGWSYDPTTAPHIA